MRQILHKAPRQQQPIQVYETKEQHGIEDSQGPGNKQLPIHSSFHPKYLLLPELRVAAATPAAMGQRQGNTLDTPTES